MKTIALVPGLALTAFALTFFAATARAEDGASTSTGVDPGGTTSTAATPANKDEVTGATSEEEEKKKNRNPFAGSILLFDQSMTTNSFDKGSQLSASPLYEIWISPRIYYAPTKHLKFGARFDFFTEAFTNHDETTNAHETVYGDPWLTASYADNAKFLNDDPKSRWNIGLVVRPPMSKDSRANGQYFAAGPNAGLNFGFPVAGAKSKWFPSASVGASVSYSHAFTKGTTPTSFTSFDQSRTNSQGDAVLDNQVRSGTIAGNVLLYALNAGIDIRDDLNFSASMIWIDQFSYRTPDVTVDGSAVPHSSNDTQFRQLSWFLVDLDYELTKEVSLSLGFYNLNTVVGPDGKYRNPFYSPEARAFFSVTLNLDALYDDARPKHKGAATAAASRASGLF